MYEMLRTIHSSILRSPAYQPEDSFRFEDALGRSHSLPYEYFRHIEVLLPKPQALSGFNFASRYSVPFWKLSLEEFLGSKRCSNDNTSFLVGVKSLSAKKNGEWQSFPVLIWSCLC